MLFFGVPHQRIDDPLLGINHWGVPYLKGTPEQKNERFKSQHEGSLKLGERLKKQKAAAMAATPDFAAICNTLMDAALIYSRDGLQETAKEILAQRDQLQEWAKAVVRDDQ